jgi:23S rRNA (cytosine1962-C5)-methyltransferase
MTMPEPTNLVRLKPEAAKIARKGRAWFFRDDLASSAGGAPPTGLVRVHDVEGRGLGIGLFAPDSRLALRLAGGWEGDGVPSPEEFFARRLRAAIARRRALLGPRAGVRLVHGEADDVPGLVVDSYAGGLVVQCTARAVEEMRSAWVPELVASLDPSFVLQRNDVATRKLEGLDGTEPMLLHGKRTELVEFEEGGIVHRVRPWTGQKTGFFLDQRPARALVRELAESGRARRVLDLFSYQGGFALAALRGGAERVLSIDESSSALDEAAAAVARNGLDASRWERRDVNAFTELRALRRAGDDFDLVVCDPPAFARTRREVRGALSGYRDLNRLALRVLRPGGLLVTCSCSHHVGWPEFEAVVRQAAGDLPFPVLLRRRIGAGDDHPVRLTVPESEYLKVLLVERADDDPDAVTAALPR